MTDFLKGTITPQDWVFVAVVGVLTVVVIGAGYFFFIAPTSEELVAEIATTADLRSELEQALRREKQMEELEAEAARMQALVQQFEERLPSDREIPQLLGQFEALGNEIGLSVSLATLDIQEDARTETIPYSVTADGTFHDIARFINELERDKRYLKVSDIDIESTDMGTAQASFQLSTFVFRDPLDLDEESEATK